MHRASMVFLLSKHKLPHRGKIGLRVHTHHRNLLVIGNNLLLTRPKHKINKGDVFRGHDQDKIGVNGFGKIHRILREIFGLLR